MNQPIPPDTCETAVGGTGVKPVGYRVTDPPSIVWLRSSPVDGGLTKPFPVTAGWNWGIGTNVWPVNGSYWQTGALQQGSLGSVSRWQEAGICPYVGHLNAWK